MLFFFVRKNCGKIVDTTLTPWIINQSVCKKGLIDWLLSYIRLENFSLVIWRLLNCYWRAAYLALMIARHWEFISVSYLYAIFKKTGKISPCWEAYVNGTQNLNDLALSQAGFEHPKTPHEMQTLYLLSNQGGITKIY